MQYIIEYSEVTIGIHFAKLEFFFGIMIIINEKIIGL